MKDAFNRKIDYMRISITDRCNLRCKYCLPEHIEFIPHRDVLRYEELLRICKIMSELGVKNIRVTGGEPLLRKDCMVFLEALRGMDKIENIALTTNALLLKPYVNQLVKMNLNSINISLDVLDAHSYKDMTGSDDFKLAWESIEEVLKTDLKLKINCVPIKGINDREIVKIAGLAKTNKIDVRFIELMPSSSNTSLKGMSSEEILQILKKEFPDIAPSESKNGFGPARYYKSKELMGTVGFISALSNNFCEDCNRIRLTSEGFLRLCLHHNLGLDLKELIRGGKTDEEITAKIIECVNQKPQKHELGTKINLKHMSKIGG